MKKHFLLACLLMAMGGVYPDVVNAQCGDNGDGTFSNPVFWADVPDPDVIRVGDDFYMVSTTMHLVPGAPIMHSKDLVNWEIDLNTFDTYTLHPFHFFPTLNDITHFSTRSLRGIIPVSIGVIPQI